MSGFRQTLKSIIPDGLKPAVRDTYDAVRRLPDWPAATFHPLRRQSIQRMGEMKDSHRGERCFILGNGPSLKNTDLSRLKNETTFGMNRVYMAFPEMGFPTTYYVSMNDLVIEQCARDIEKLPMPRFLSWRSRRFIQTPGEINFIFSTYTGPGFSKDICGRVWESATVTYVALQLAYHMGFSEVILIGVDHNFTTKGTPNTTVVSQGDDPNHFNPGYFGKGFRWQLPDLETSEIGYKMARQVYEEDGRKVIDATVGGKLTIFPKADYNSLF